MRFCMVTTFYPPYNFGGDGIFVHQLSNELAKRGHHVEVVHCRDAHQFLSGGTPSMPYQDHPNVTVHGLKSPAGFLSPLVTQQTGCPVFKSSQLKSILEKPFDVIHFHNISLIGGPKVLEYGRAVKLYTLHEYWLVCPTHMLFKFGQEVCTEQSCFACTIVHRRPPQMWRYTRMIEEALNHVDLFVAPSEFTMQKHREMGLQRPIAELPYFTSRWSHDQPTEIYASREVPYFLFVGRLEKIKGLQNLIPVFWRYRNAQLWIAGTGEYERAFRAMAADSPNIKFLGHQSGEQLRLLYEQAVATIVPSIWYEVFGIVILESFTQKTPVIVSNRGGMPKVVNNSGGGFVFNTEAELIGAMDRLLNEPSLREQMGQRGYQALKQQWSAEVHIPQYLTLIEQVTGSRA
jgi:glycosyltransferase involved in cell wall biosynthesis